MPTKPKGKGKGSHRGRGRGRKGKHAPRKHVISLIADGAAAGAAADALIQPTSGILGSGVAGWTPLQHLEQPFLEKGWNTSQGRQDALYNWGSAPIGYASNLLSKDGVIILLSRPVKRILARTPLRRIKMRFGRYVLALG